MSLVLGGRLLRRHLAPQRHALWRLGLWSAVEAVPAFLAGLLVAQALDQGFLAGRPLVGFGWLALLGVLWAVGAVGTRQLYPWLAAVLEPLRDSLVTTVVTASIRRAVREQRTDNGASIAQATIQVESVRALVAALLRTLRQLLAGAIAAIGGLAVLSPMLALVVSAFVVVAVAVFAVVLRILFIRYRTVVLCEEQITAVAAPRILGMREVVAAAAERRVAGEVGEVIDAEAEASRAFARASALRLPVLTLGAHLPLIAVLAMSPWLLAGGHLTVGQIVGCVVYLASGLEPAIQLLVNAGSTILVTLNVVLARLAEAGADGGARPTIGGARPAGYDIEVDRVTFAYSRHAEPVVRDLTLRLPEGIHLAVVGPSGVGKSTLANLVARLVIPNRGALRFGGVALPSVDERHLRQRVALIPQEAYVFAGTVRENIAYLCPGAGDDEISSAVTAVGLEETVARLGGLDGGVEPGGGTLSPGERQLVALARAYLSPAQVVILDEATCHLDPAAETRAERAFAQRHGTLVVIAHRISSALRADRILVMDGEQTAIGSHAELLERSPLYATLVGYWGDGSAASPRPVADLPGQQWPTAPDLVARGIGWRYGPRAEPVLHDVHLTVAHGEHLVIVGPPGAGPSTLAAALTGSITPQSGTVSLGDQPPAQAPAGALRSLVARIPKHAYVLRGTVRTNLTALAPDADDERLTAAAAALGASGLLDDGLDASAEGLSAADRQLLGLVRAYVSDAQIVVLDEATGHLDPASEAHVERAFRRRGGTLIVVPHRMSSATRGDRVVLLDRARTAVGHHDELVDTSTRYARMWAAWRGAPEAHDRVPALVTAGDDALARLRPWRARGRARELAERGR